MSEKSAKTVLTKAGKILLGAAIIGYVIYSGRLDFGKMGRADWRWVIAGWAVLLVLPVVGWLRWHAVLRMQGIRIGILSTLRIFLIGSLFNAVLLGATGGDVVKAYYVATGEGSSKKAAAVITVVIDRLLGTTALILIVGFSLPIAWSTVFAGRPLAVFAILLVAGYASAVLGLLFLAIPRFRRRRHEYLKRRACEGTGTWSAVAGALDEMDGAVQELVKHPGWTVLCVAASALSHAASIVSFCFFLKALAVHGLPIYVFAVLVPLSLAANGLPVLPAGGLGLGELVASEVFNAGVASGRAIGGTAMFMWRIGLYLTVPLGFVFFIMQRDEVRRAFRAASSAPPGGPDLRVAQSSGCHLGNGGASDGSTELVEGPE